MDDRSRATVPRSSEGREAWAEATAAAGRGAPLLIAAVLAGACATTPQTQPLDPNRVGHTEAFSRSSAPPGPTRTRQPDPAPPPRESSIDLAGVRLGPAAGGDDEDESDGDAGTEPVEAPELPPAVVEPPGGASS